MLNCDTVLDHVVIVVSDLGEAVANFKRLGFYVQYGGKTGPVYNALITFQDGTYIELTSVVSKYFRWLCRCLYVSGVLRAFEIARPSLMLRFLFWFGGPVGLRDWCLRCNELSSCVTALQSNGLETTEIKEFKRTRPDGQVAEWLLAAPKNRQLPFFIQDISSSDIRAPYKNTSSHSNGVTGISAITIKTDSKNKESVFRLFGQPADDMQDIKIGGVHCRFTDNRSAPYITLELMSDGKTKGILPFKLAYNTIIEVI